MPTRLRSLTPWLIAALLSLAAAVPASAEVQPAGSVVSCTTGKGLADCALDSGGRIRVEFQRDDLVRVRVSSEAVFHDRPTGALVPQTPDANAGDVFDGGNVLILFSSKMAVALMKAPLRLVIWRADGSLISVDDEGAYSWDRASGLVMTRKTVLPGEHYLGLGERGGPIDRKGRRLTMRNVDWAAYDSMSDPLYISIPYFASFKDGMASGVYVDSGATPFFDFDTASTGIMNFGVVAGDLDYYVMGGPTPLAVAQGYRWLTGANQLPPAWALGYHQSRYSYMSQNEAISVAWLLRQLSIPADVMYFDIDYLDRLRMFTWNAGNFPDPASMNALLKSWGYRSVTIMEPLNRTDDPLYQYLALSGYYLTGPGGTPLVNSIWYGDVSWLDFSKSAVRAWYKQASQIFLAVYGVDGVWNDLNEPAQNFMLEARYDFDGQPRSDVEARNLYALLQAKTSYEAQRELRPDQRPWIFSRSGFSGLHRYGANWGGDADSSFASLRTNVEMTASMGLSGQPFFGHDIGGFLGSPSAELFLRWMTFSAYTPLFRNHAMNTSAPREPWAFGEPYLSMIRNIVNERYRLIPYLYSLFRHDATRGEPVISPLPFYFPADAATFTVNDQFLVGPSILVAPIAVEGATSRPVYLPAGAAWIDQRTDVREAGGRTVIATAAIDDIPVFVRDGSVIPRGPVAESTSVQSLDRSLDVYCGVPAEFELYDDDRISHAYEQGVFLTTRIRCTPGPVTSISIERQLGSWTPPASRVWTVHLHRIAAMPAAVSRNSLALPFAATEAALAGLAEGWTYTANQRVIVKVTDQPAALTIAVQQ